MRKAELSFLRLLSSAILLFVRPVARKAQLAFRWRRLTLRGDFFGGLTPESDIVLGPQALRFGVRPFRLTAAFRADGTLRGTILFLAGAVAQECQLALGGRRVDAPDGLLGGLTPQATIVLGLQVVRFGARQVRLDAVQAYLKGRSP